MILKSKAREREGDEETTLRFVYLHNDRHRSRLSFEILRNIDSLITTPRKVIITFIMLLRSAFALCSEPGEVVGSSGKLLIISTEILQEDPSCKQ